MQRILKYACYACLLLLFSCQGVIEKKEAQLKQPVFAVTENQDSINSLLLEISAAEKKNKLKSFFNALHNKRGFNGTVLVSQMGQEIYKEAFGVFNREKKVSLNSSSLFQLASVTKQFTAIAILMLVEQGKLKLEQGVEQIINGFPYKNITIKMLLCHRSGLPDYRYFCDISYKSKNKTIHNSEVIEMMNTLKPDLYYRADKHFDYNNTNYMLLATIIEKISGLTYAAFLKKNIFDRIGMKSTFVYDGIETPEKVALGYSAGWRRLLNDYQNGVVGDKNIYSNIEDLFLWDKALYQPQFIKTEILKKAFQWYSKEMKTRNYGFGFRSKILPYGDTIYFHGGWWRGYNHIYYRRQRDRTAIIVLSNRVNFCINNLQGVWDILEGEKYYGVANCESKDDKEEL